MKHSQEVFGVAVVTNDEPAVVLKPRKKSLDFPASAIAAQTTSVLRSVLAIAPVRRDYFDSVLPQFGIQLVGILCVVAATSMIFLPFPRLVLPTFEPLFSPRRNYLRCRPPEH